MRILKKILIGLGITILLFFIISFGITVYSTVSRPVEYADEIQRYSQEYDVDPLLVLSVIKVESNFDTKAVSKAGANGLMQIMPDTAKSIQRTRKEEFHEDLITNPHKNIEMGVYYLSYLLHHFKDQDLAMAAYNGGIGNVKKWLSDDKLSKDGETLDNIPFSETRYYVVKIENQHSIYKLFYQDEKLSDNMHKSPKIWVKNYLKIIKNIINNY